MNNSNRLIQPSSLPVIEQNIPRSLKQRNQWVIWQAENKRLQEMDDEEEARAECYRLAQVRTGRDI
jgi:hypothetical protein